MYIYKHSQHHFLRALQIKLVKVETIKNHKYREMIVK